MLNLQYENPYLCFDLNRFHVKELQKTIHLQKNMSVLGQAILELFNEVIFMRE